MESQEFLSASRLHQLPTTTCPNCQMVWLAPGLQDGDTYECRKCEISFVVRVLDADLQPSLEGEASPNFE